MKTHLALALAAALTFAASAADWPQFRGPASSGVAPEAALPLKPKIDWSAALPGRGLASPIVIGDRVFTTASSGPRQERLHVLAFRTADGAPAWQRELRATGRTMAHPKTSVAACSPCSDGTRIFALWSSNDLAAFDLDGRLLWLRGLTADYPNVSNSLGMASSLITIGDTLVVTVENDSESYTLGVDSSTGKNRWRLDRPKAANWTSPLPLGGGAVALQSSKGILAVDATTGSRLWEYTGGASTTSSGVVHAGILYAASNGITALAPRAGAEPEQRWRAKGINPATISPLILGPRLYSINGAGVLATADIQTGDAGWKLRLTGPFSASPVAAGAHLAAISEKGLLQIIDTTAAEGALTGQLQLPLDEAKKDLILSTPAISGKNLFIRSDATLWRIGSE